MTAVAAPSAQQTQRIVLDDVSWQTYETLLRELDGRPIRLTYDRGRLEIMTLSHEHEYNGYLIGRLLEMFAFEMGIVLHGGKSTTFRHEAAQRGLEPDECYWIQHEPQMRGRREFDIEQDPPPDLAIEIDITRSSFNRLDVYAGLGIPEIWIFDGERLTVLCLEAGRYVERDRSLALPQLPPAEVIRFLRLSSTKNEHEVLRSFVAWIRKEIKGKGRGRSRKPKRPRKK